MKLHQLVSLVLSLLCLTETGCSITRPSDDPTEAYVAAMTTRHKDNAADIMDQKPGVREEWVPKLDKKGKEMRNPASGQIIYVRSKVHEDHTYFDLTQKADRDKWAYELIGQIDSFYYTYEAELYGGRALTNTVTDSISLALTAAATVVGGAQAKAILAAIDTGLKGIKQTVDKDIFDSFASAAMVDEMRGLRLTKKTAIYKDLTELSPEEYPAQKVLIDIIEYFNVGTAVNALQQLAKDARKKLEDAQALAATDAKQGAAAEIAPLLGFFFEKIDAEVYSGLERVDSDVWTKAKDGHDRFKEAKYVVDKKRSQTVYKYKENVALDSGEITKDVFCVYETQLKSDDEKKPAGIWQESITFRFEKGAWTLKSYKAAIKDSASNP